MISRFKDIFAHYAARNDWVNLYYHFIKYSIAKILGFLLGEQLYAKWFYYTYTKKKLNMKDPVFYDEKVWWLKLNNRDPLLTTCSDKIAVREYVKEHGFENLLIPQLDSYSDTSMLNLDKYHDEVIVKCSHNSGGHFFYDPNNKMSHKAIETAKKRLSFILKQDASVLSREWNYKNIPHKLIVEKVIRDKHGNLPLDYKFMCFDGEPRLLFLDLGVINPNKTYNPDYPRNIYDMEFNLMPIIETRPNATYQVPKPDNFDTMVKIARDLSKPFVHCRVDLYNIDGKIYFGEITFYHGGGCNNIQPIEWDKRMGDWINIDSKKIVLRSSN